MLNKEKLHSTTSFCLANHPELDLNMRTILIDWLSNISSMFKFQRSTFHLSINLMHRFLGLTKNIPRHRFQLLGLICLSLASKIEVIIILF